MIRRRLSPPKTSPKGMVWSAKGWVKATLMQAAARYSMSNSAPHWTKDPSYHWRDRTRKAREK